MESGGGGGVQKKQKKTCSVRARQSRTTSAAIYQRRIMGLWREINLCLILPTQWDRAESHFALCHVRTRAMIGTKHWQPRRRLCMCVVLPTGSESGERGCWRSFISQSSQWKSCLRARAKAIKSPGGKVGSTCPFPGPSVIIPLMVITSAAIRDEQFRFWPGSTPEVRARAPRKRKRRRDGIVCGQFKIKSDKLANPKVNTGN